MKINSSDLVQDLVHRVKVAAEKAQGFKNTPEEILNRRETDSSWSVLECLEHLNLYGDYYLPEIEKSILRAKPETKQGIFKSGWLGNYFAHSMLPKKGEVKNKMKTFNDKNPIHSTLDKTTIDRFLKQQEKMLDLLDMANRVNLNKTKTSISISRLIRLKLGDTFRFTIYHIERHILQAEKALLRNS